MSTETPSLKLVPWETRNLGMSSYTLTEEFRKSPDIALLKQEIEAAETDHSRIFIQVRLPKDEYALVPRLAQLGFYCIETTLEAHTRLESNEVYGRFKVSKDEFVPKRYQASDFDLVRMVGRHEETCDAIRAIAAESFLDDRFHRDPNCTKEIADQRFVFWVNDLMNDLETAVGTIQLKSTGEPIGFGLRKLNNLILAGTSGRYRGSGIAEHCALAMAEDAEKEGQTRIETIVSANNTSIVNMYIRLGFKFRHPSMTLHYWSSQRQNK